MAHIDGEIVIDRPMQEVYDFVADERNEPRYHPQMRRVQQLTRGPIGPGTRFRSELGRNVAMVWEITAYERPRRLGGKGCTVLRVITDVPALETQGTLTFDPAPGGTRMCWSWQIEPCGVFKLLTPLVVRLGQRQETRVWTTLKQLLERQQTPLAHAER